MLHILGKKDKGAGIAQAIMSKRNPDGSIGTAAVEEEKSSDPIESCAREMIDAFKLDDHKALAAALRAAFEILDSEPHEEGPHIEMEHLK